MQSSVATLVRERWYSEVSIRELALSLSGLTFRDSGLGFAAFSGLIDKYLRWESPDEDVSREMIEAREVTADSRFARQA